MSLGGGQTSTQQQTSGPPAWEVPSLQYGANQARQLYQMPSPSYYPGSTVANLSPATQAGIQAATARGLGGDPTVNAGANYLQRVMGGQYLGGTNLDPVHESIRAATLPSIAAQFSSAGRYGSPDMAGTETTALANAFAPYDYGQYQNERQAQQQAAQFAPGYGQASWQDIQGLQGAGQQQDVQAQNLINANIAQWNYNQQLAGNKLSQYMGLLLNPAFGSQGTSTATQPGGGITGLLGGVLGGILG